MSRSATARSVRSAGRVIKRLMNFHPEGWEEPEAAGREAIRRVLEDRMQERVRRWLAVDLPPDHGDRRNGSYSRHLLTGLGDIELHVPRTRRFSPVGIVQAYA